jgi:hypothetical protein
MHRTYSSKSAAKAAIKKQGLQLMPHTIEAIGFDRWKPIFTPEIMEDVEEIERRGFRAKLSPPPPASASTATTALSPAT